MIEIKITNTQPISVGDWVFIVRPAVWGRILRLSYSESGYKSEGGSVWPSRYLVMYPHKHYCYVKGRHAIKYHISAFLNESEFITLSTPTDEEKSELHNALMKDWDYVEEL